jgi:signal transduction histidine kinase
VTGPADTRIPRAMPADAAPPAVWPLLRRLAGEHAEERVYRVLAFAFVPGGVLFGLLGAPPLLAQADLWPAWWSAAAFVIGIAPSLVLGLLAFRAPLGVLRAIARVNVAGTLLVLASIPFVVMPDRSLHSPIWFVDICGLGLVAAALAVRPWWTVVVAVAGGALSFVARMSLGDAEGPIVSVQGGLYVLLFTLTFIALGVSSLSAAREADLAEAEAEAATAGAAADAARERERARINELVHDRVLATLLTAARQIPGSGGLEQRDARRALEGLQALLRDDVEPEDLAGERFVWKVQAVTTDLLPEALFNYEVAGDGVVPGVAAEALLDSAEEAIRNSLRHAGPANRTVHVEVGDRCVDVDVLDDGVGFERAAVPPGRLGLSESIEGRMRMLPGGSAAVISQPGVGTRVSLRWRAP